MRHRRTRRAGRRWTAVIEVVAARARRALRVVRARAGLLRDAVVDARTREAVRPPLESAEVCAARASVADGVRGTRALLNRNRIHAICDGRTRRANRCRSGIGLREITCLACRANGIRRIRAGHLRSAMINSRARHARGAIRREVVTRLAARTRGRAAAAARQGTRAVRDRRTRRTGRCGAAVIQVETARALRALRSRSARTHDVRDAIRNARANRTRVLNAILKVRSGRTLRALRIRGAGAGLR